MVNQTQIKQGLISYIDQEIIAKAPPMQKFLIGIAVGASLPKADKIINQYITNPMAKQLELVDKDGFVDIDKVYELAKESYKKAGPLEYMGITFDNKDIDKIYKHIKGE